MFNHHIILIEFVLIYISRLQIWNTLRTTRLQQEVHQMDSQLRGLMRLMGLENDINLEELYEVVGMHFVFLGQPQQMICMH